jgi:hypothetical protein
MLKKISKIALKVFPAILVGLTPLLIPSGSASAATVAVPMTGTARAATAAEITALGTPTIDVGTTIPGRGNAPSLNTSGWNANPNRDLQEGHHELAVIIWDKVNIPECATSIHTVINATIERRNMDISTMSDSLEWAHFLLKGTPSSPEPWNPDNSIRDTQGRYKTTTFGGTNLDGGEEVPANQSANYLITRSNIDTTSLTRADLATGLFSGIYLDTFSNPTGPKNISWFAKINSATVTYDDTQCNTVTPPVTPTTTTPAPTKPKTGNLAVATLVTVTILAALLFAARIVKTKMHTKANSAK